MDPYNNPSPPSKFHEETLLTRGGGLLGRKSNLGRGGGRGEEAWRTLFSPLIFVQHGREGEATTLKQGLLSFPWHDKTRRELARLEFPPGAILNFPCFWERKQASWIRVKGSFFNVYKLSLCVLVSVGRRNHCLVFYLWRERGKFPN